MRILLATPTFPPFKDGVSEAASAQANAFAAAGFDVYVATEPHAGRLAHSNHPRITIREFSISGSPHFRYPFQGETSLYRDYLNSKRWDIIVFHSYAWPLYLAADYLSQIQSRTILTSHGYGALVWTPARKFPFGLGTLFWSVIKSMSMLRWYKYLDRVVFLDSKIDSASFYDHFLARVVRHTGIRIIPNGVASPISDADRLARSFLDRYRISATKPLFLCVANYSWRKDQGFAARAFRQADIPGSTLIFIGSEFNECSDAFRKADYKASTHLQGGNIVWLEKVTREHTLGALQACDAFVLSANHEAQPIVLLEAMSYGKPWIARKAGCIDRLEGGLCVRSVDAMAESMRKITMDGEQRSRLAEDGRQAAKARYSLRQYGRSYCYLVKELLRTTLSQ